MPSVDALLFALTLCAALGCGLIAGVFFAFSAFVMKALARLPQSGGIAAMQSINVAVINPLFLAVFLGTAAACVVAVICSLLRWHDPGSVYVLVGSGLYLIGCFLVTVVFNVPRNNRLAAVAPADADAASLWASYVVGWTAWNHIRAAASLAAAALLTVALCQGAAKGDSRVSQHKADDWPRLFERPLNAGDLDAVMGLYEPDARFVTKSGETVVGRDKIRDALAALIRAKARPDSRVVRAVTAGDIALLYTDFQGTAVEASGKTVEVRHEAIEVLRRQPGGTWELIVGDPGGRER